MERVTSLKPFGAPKAPQFFYFFIFLSPPPKAAVALTGAPRAPKGGTEGATPPEGEGNPAEGGSSRVLLYMYRFHSSKGAIIS